jgi:phytoene dehydrogenase-like protein
VGALNAIAALLGEVGLPEPVSALAARDWDAVVVGGGHNGLTCAAYLARDGRSVLVLERAERLGGACTLERPFADDRFVISPCAYVVGLLDPRVIADLELTRRGVEIYRADPSIWVPFEDGSSFGIWHDDARTQASLDALGVSRADSDGFWGYQRLFADLRRRLRLGARDAWVGAAPSRTEIEALLGGERTLIDVVFEASIADVLDDFVSDQRIKDALFGSGIIGTWAGPRDRGTAWVHLMHHSGDAWSYVKGGMGMISFAIADAAREAGAVLAAGVPVAEVVPGEGVRLEDGTLIRARTVISNADPKRLLSLLGAGATEDFRARVDAWDVRSPVVKFNAALSRLPRFTAAGDDDSWARGTVDVTEGLDAGQRAFERCAAGEPAVSFGEIYVQTLHDPSPAPPGKHLMSVFAQYGPWGAPSEELGRQILDLIARFAPDVEDCVEHFEVLGPREIEERVGLSGGNIFQGQVLPEQMWEHRFAPRTGVPGVYLCGAATHPAGSVIATNGRNAAEAVLADVRAR